MPWVRKLEENAYQSLNAFLVETVLAALGMPEFSLELFFLNLILTAQWPYELC